MKTPKTQREAILMHLAYGGKLSAIEATKKQFGYCTKLSTRISDYVKEGYVFIKEKKKRKTIFGESCYYFEYSLEFKKTSKKLINSLLYQ